MAKLSSSVAVCTLVIIAVLHLDLSPYALAHASSASTSDSTQQTGNVRNSGLVWVKIGSLIIVFVATFVGGISPYFYKWNNAFLVLGTQFAGGVFLATALIHFLPDAHKTFQERTDVDYPFAFMLATAGYLLTMCGDCVIQWIFERETTAGRVNVPNGNTKSAFSKPKSPIDTQDNRCCQIEEKRADVGLKIAVATDAALNDKCSCCGQSLKCCTCAEQVSEPIEVRNIVKATLITTASFGDSILLIIALCFHSIFEGIAIGVAETKADAWKALWTVCLHKIFAAIAMGIALLRMIPDRPFISASAYSFLFAISSPIGITAGILIDATTEGPVADWVYAISMGFASGVFVYVAINHLLSKGYNPPCQVAVDAPFYKFIAVLTGATVIAIVMIWDT